MLLEDSSKSGKRGGRTKQEGWDVLDNLSGK